MSRVVLALIVSFTAFGIIFVLDKIADLESTGESTDQGIFSIIGGLGILVGFSWEQSFDGGVEAIAALTSRPLMAECGLALLVTIVVMPAWQKYILKTVIELADERAEKQEKA